MLWDKSLEANEVANPRFPMVTTRVHVKGLAVLGSVIGFSQYCAPKTKFAAIARPGVVVTVLYSHSCLFSRIAIAICSCLRQLQKGQHSDDEQDGGRGGHRARTDRGSSSPPAPVAHSVGGGGTCGLNATLGTTRVTLAARCLARGRVERAAGHTIRCGFAHSVGGFGAGSLDTIASTHVARIARCLARGYVERAAGHTITEVHMVGQQGGEAYDVVSSGCTVDMKA